MDKRTPRRRRWTIGALLLLIALIAVGLAIERRVREWQTLRCAHPHLATIQALALGSLRKCEQCHAAVAPRPDALGRLVGSIADEVADRGLAFSSRCLATNQGGDCRKCHAP
jgi:hypothetical protein